jgi:hypothetical protein
MSDLNRCVDLVDFSYLFNGGILSIRVVRENKAFCLYHRDTDYIIII